MNFRGLTWNIFLQETFEVVGGRPNDDLSLPGFIPRKIRATRGVRGRGKGGLKTLLNGRLFGHGLVTNVPTLFDDFLVVRWSDTQGPGILFLNIYVPRHADEGK